MTSFEEIENQIKKGDVLILNQMNGITLNDVHFVANVVRNQENICGCSLEEEQFHSMFPRIKYYMGYHAYYLQAKYNPESKKFVSAIMTKNFRSGDSVVKGSIGSEEANELVESADDLMDSMFKLEEKITMTMQSSDLLQKIKV